jgi:hypothetical protein
MNSSETLWAHSAERGRIIKPEVNLSSLFTAAGVYVENVEGKVDILYTF